MPAEALRSLTSILGLREPDASVQIVGRDPILQTRFRIGDAAAAALRAVGLATPGGGAPRHGPGPGPGAIQEGAGLVKHSLELTSDAYAGWRKQGLETSRAFVEAFKN